MKNKIIQALKGSSEFLSGEEISRAHNISRSAIWKNIEELRKDGYSIEATPHRGYKLVAFPDKLYSREIQDHLKTKMMGHSMHYFDEIPSSMDEAYERARQGAIEGEVIITESQTKGRGRLGRTWSSPKGKGIYLSVILRPTLKPSDVAKITLMAGVALCEAINETTGVNTQIKWPNDILFEGKKVAGILTELNAEMDRVHFCVVGIGVNVNARCNQIPDTATSLKAIVGKTLNRVALTQAILERMEHWYEQLQVKKFDEILEQWKALSFTLGQNVRMGDIEGKAVNIDEYGALVIKQKNGELIKQFSGDVSLL